MMQNDDFALVLQDVVLNNGGKIRQSTAQSQLSEKLLSLKNFGLLFLKQNLRFGLDGAVWGMVE
jgi:hypothetical protein